MKRTLYSHEKGEQSTRCFHCEKPFNGIWGRYLEKRPTPNNTTGYMKFEGVFVCWDCLKMKGIRGRHKWNIENGFSPFQVRGVK